MVMCSEPVTRTPCSGFPAAYFRRIDINPGISCSAIEISLRPQSARPMSATLYGKVCSSVAVGIKSPLFVSPRISNLLRLDDPQLPPNNLHLRLQLLNIPIVV